MRPVRLPLILLLILAALAPTSAMASEWYRCQADGEVRQACCCPQQEEGEEPAPDSPQGIERSCCCDIDRADPRTSDLRATAEAGSVVAGLAMPIETVRMMPATPEAVAVVAISTPAQPRGPPSLFLRHCSLLL